MHLIDPELQVGRVGPQLDARIAVFPEQQAFIQEPGLGELERELPYFNEARPFVACANEAEALQLAPMASSLRYRRGDRARVRYLLAPDAWLTPNWTFE